MIQKTMKIIERQREFMKTIITFKVIQNDESTIKTNEAIELAYDEFDRVVEKYTRFDESSELSKLNISSGKWVEVSKEFLYLIKYMLDLAQKTDGAFDPTIIDFLEVYGYDKDYDFSKLDNPQLDSLVKKIVDERKPWQDIEVKVDSSEVRLAKGQRIDLGGIGKGYAIDLAYKHLDEALDHFLIDAGGDIRVKGLNDKGEKWLAGLKVRGKNGEPETIGTIPLESGEALASSGSWARKVKQFHHLINPQTGKPVEKTYSTVFVKGPSGIETDSWATALFVNRELDPGNSFHVLFN